MVRSISSCRSAVSTLSRQLALKRMSYYNTRPAAASPRLNAAAAVSWQPNQRQQIRWHGGPSVSEDAPTITATFVTPATDGEEEETKVVQARVGETLLQTAHRNDIDLEGACEGVCACSTCHLILPSDLYDTLPEPSEDEEDMLDMAFGLTETSRLGCQITVTDDMDGIVLKLPSATRNFYVDGHKPQPH